MTLVADANVLIDLEYLDGLPVLSRLEPVEVLDVVLKECQDPRQPGLTQHLQQAGATIVATEPAWLSGAMSLKTAALSIQDCLNLYYAQHYGRVLLTNDGPIRNRCHELQVTVHGVLWVVQEAHSKALVDPSELCRWLTVLSAPEMRLPSNEIHQLRQLIGCP